MSDKPKTHRQFLNDMGYEEIDFDRHCKLTAFTWSRSAWSAAVEATRQEMQAEIDKRDAELLDLRMDKMLLHSDEQRILVNDLPYLCKRFGFNECLANLAARNGTPRILWIAKLIEDLESDVNQRGEDEC